MPQKFFPPSFNKQFAALSDPDRVITVCRVICTPAGGADCRPTQQQQQPGIPPYLAAPREIKSRLEIETE